MLAVKVSICVQNEYQMKTCEIKGKLSVDHIFFPLSVGKHCTTCVVMASDMVRLHLDSDAEQPRAWLSLTDRSTAPASTFWLSSEVFSSLFYGWLYLLSSHVPYSLWCSAGFWIPCETSCFRNNEWVFAAKWDWGFLLDSNSCHRQKCGFVLDRKSVV